MVRIIVLQRPAVCAGCGAVLPAGVNARYYSADKIYCETHQKEPRGNESPVGDIQQPQLAEQPVQPSQPQPRVVVLTHQDFADLSTEIGTLQASVHYNTQELCRVRDLLSMLIMLKRMEIGGDGDKKDTLNFTEPQAKPKATKVPGRKD